MTRQEFLDGLKAALAVSNRSDLVTANINYYNQYLDGEIAKGRSESEVLEELGSPALIAKSILKAEGIKGVTEGGPAFDAKDTPDGDPTTFAQGRAFTEQDAQRDAQNTNARAERSARRNADNGPRAENPQDAENASGSRRKTSGSRFISFSGWKGCLLTILILLIIFFILRGILLLIGGLLGALFAPIL